MHPHPPTPPPPPKKNSPQNPKTKPIKLTEKFLCNHPLKLFQNTVDTLIFNSINLLTPPKRFLSTCNY